MRTNPLLRRGIAVVVIALLLALAFAPNINADVSMEDLVKVTTEFCGLGKKHSVQLTQDEAEAKEYLFQTIIDIANNPKVQILLEQVKDERMNNNRFIDSKFDSRKVFLKLLIKNPRFLKSMIFTKSSITMEYLHFTYDNGCELVNIFGEDESINITESIKISNPEIFDDLTNIIMDNHELNTKITKLAVMNSELNPVSPFWHFPIICAILLICFFSSLIGTMISDVLSFIFYNNPILFDIFHDLSFFFVDLAFAFIVLYGFVFECYVPSVSGMR